MHFEETAEDIIRSRGREEEGRRLHRLFDLAWEYTLHEFPEFATYVGRSRQGRARSGVLPAASARARGASSLLNA